MSNAAFVSTELIYDVPSEWSHRAYMDDAGYRAKYEASVKDPERFWAEEAKRIHWFQEPTRIKNTNFGPDNVAIRWFEDGVTNVAYNCVDRHLHTRGDQVAIIWEGDDPGESKRITYRELHAEVGRMANIMRNRGVSKGDRVTIYMPMIPEAAYAMLACARLGAIHSVVFGGFSPDSLASRIQDAQTGLRDHRGRGPARRPQGAAEGERGCRDRPRRRRRSRDRRAPHGHAHEHGAGPRRLLRRSRRHGDGRLPRGGDERGGSALHPLHLGSTGSPRACSTPPAAISSGPRSRINTCSTTTTATSTGAPRMWAG
jgi:hypothetical protein